MVGNSNFEPSSVSVGLNGSPEVPWRLCRRKRENPSASKIKIAPTATPTPIPALAPGDKSDGVSADCCARAVGVGVEDVVAVAVAG